MQDKILRFQSQISKVEPQNHLVATASTHNKFNWNNLACGEVGGLKDRARRRGLMDPYSGNNYMFDYPINPRAEWTSFNPSQTSIPIESAFLPIHDQFDTGFQALPASTAPPDGEQVAASKQPPQPDIEPQHPRRISRQEWESHREVIKSNYSSKTLKELRIFIAASEGFVARQANIKNAKSSESQWKKKLMQWGLNDKNLKPHVTKFIRKRAQRRLMDGNRPAQFTIRGEPVPMDKIERYLKNPPENPNSPTGSTPSEVTYKTISPHLMTMNLNVNESLPQGVEPHEMPPPPPRLDAESLGTFKMAFWDGHPISHFLSEFTAAESHVHHDDYQSAKPKFIKAVQGCSALLGPIHAQTVMVRRAFIKEALKYSDHATAIDMVHQSHNAHRNILGADHKKTWKSLASMGKAYLNAKMIHDAYHMLFNAREGMRRHATLAGPEDVYLCTKDITMDIISILKDQQDFEAVEKEYMQLIMQAEGLGEIYLPDAALLKHDLVHLFWAQGWDQTGASGRPHLPPSRMEELMMSIVAMDKFPSSYREKRACALEHLRSFYEQTRQDVKLVGFLENVETELSAAMLPDNHNLWTLKRGVAFSFSRLGMIEKAEWWYLHLNQENENGINIPPRIVLTSLIDLAQMYLSRGLRDQAQEQFEKAQKLAKEILPQDHSFHKRIQQSILQGKPVSGCCPDCHINPMSTPDSRQVSNEIHTLQEEANREVGDFQDNDSEESHGEGCDHEDSDDER
ncbi:hypothetical protein FHL15_004742 [Xylaria flabelliformis]|uniref:Clr5 domain-containing protein n=1 Tax=Xylaria flabelliformis TaxID=2512241 RepID=A0A553I248_9PEZI|nr:hypothetical protein FHL15_004742 [Xylaria flabelliformis]